ncbi:MAG: aminotransferase class III-fold pyridoxal phosphate-dependent enzyme [Pseudomonadota bacterium]
MDTYTLFILLSIFPTFWLLGKIRVRLQLSMAKHPSLRGHSKWSRRISKLIPYFEYDQYAFFNSDKAPETITKKRINAFNRLKEKLNKQYFHSISFSDSLEKSVSDVAFTNAYRVPFPYQRFISENIRIANVAIESSDLKLKDLDSNWNYDLFSSYGVNVFGYDFYKHCMAEAYKSFADLGPVLGPYHPLIKANVLRLKKISGLDEISFHMSGTEAVMQAVRLARYHTGKTHLVRFCGAYHGWWDGVQPGIGNQRESSDIYTLEDLSENTIRVLNTRNDIACILINPLQALHPNSDAASDATLISSSRSANFDRQSYTKWLQRIREICTRRDIVLIIDDIFTGFRLAYRGAQEYFKVQGDIVTYGKTLGGGLAVGVVCGKHNLMKRFKPNQPANVSFARGTFNSHPYLMACMNEFLKQIELPKYQELYQNSDALWNNRVIELNRRLEQLSVPVKIINLSTVWTLTYTLPSRYNWMYQFYLREQSLSLGWIGSGRFILSLNYSDEDYEQLMQAIVRAGEKMLADGWWWQDAKLTNKSIQRQYAKDIISSRIPQLKKVLH